MAKKCPPQNKFLVNNHMVCFAFRYALGRQSTAPGIVVEHLIGLWPHLNKCDREQIVREIEGAIGRGEAGAKIDVDEWKRVLAIDLHYQEPK
jgi:hypothetical protein